MELRFEETELNIGDTHVRDFAETDRTETKRRLDFIAAKLGNTALDSINLRDEISKIS